MYCQSVVSVLPELVILWLYTDDTLDNTKSKLLSVYYQFIVSLFCIVSVLSVCFPKPWVALIFHIGWRF